MSPFAAKLRKLRFQKTLKQHELAERLECTRAYISQLEVDVRPPPSEDFLASVVSRLQLNAAEEGELRDAHARSKRQYEMPVDLAEEGYDLAHLFHGRLERLSPSQVRVITEVLMWEGKAPAKPAVADPDRPLRRRDRRNKTEENTM